MRVSIGLPVFNGMPYLPDAIASLLAQDHADLEIVICDNASTDGTREYCEDVSRREPRIRYHRFEVNSGSAVNFGRCLELSTGEYFAWAAHDDRLDPRFVSTCLAALRSRPEAAMSVPFHRIVDEGGRVLEVRHEPKALAHTDLSTRLHAHLWRRGWLTVYGLARREFLEIVGPPPPVWGSDVILVWRILLLAPIAVVEEPLADYRVFRAKTADSVATGVTAAPSRLRHPYTGMRHALNMAGSDLPIREDSREVARATVRRWTRSRFFRQMAFADLYVEMRRLWSTGARARALVLAPAMIALSPGMTVAGVRRELRARRDRA